MTIDRIDYLDYLSMTIPSTIAFVLRSPPISYVSNIYYLPFTGTVWLCSIALVVLCTVVIALTLKFHLKSGKETEHLKMSDYFLFAVASACQMGTDIITKVLSTRISMVSPFTTLFFNSNAIIILNYFAVFFLHCITLHLYIIHCKYSGIATIDDQINSND